MQQTIGVVTRVLAALVVTASVVSVQGDGALLAQAKKGPPSKIPAAIADRIARIEAARGAGLATAELARRFADHLLKVDENGDIEVEFHAVSQVGSQHANALAAFGARILHSTANSPWPAGAPAGLGIITVRIPPGRLAAAAALPWVAAVRPAENNPPDVGIFLSEGVALHNSDDANTAGFTGAGVTVGVISNGVSNIAAAQALGDLPATVNVINAGSGDEGTAMLEIVHDLAPGAALAFHGTGGGVAGHITALNNLAAAGAQVIAEDIPFDAEPAFQKGAAAVAAENLAVAGISVHSSAGNLGASHAGRVTATGSGGGPDGNAGPFGGCAVAPTNTVAIAGGGDTTFDVSVGAGGSISATLQWSEPRAIFPTAGQGGFTDLDLSIMDATATNCLAQSTATQANGVGDTIEQAAWTNGGAAAVTVKLVVNVSGTSSAVAAPLLDLRWRGGSAIDATTRAGSLNPDSNYTFGATSAAAANASASTNRATVPIEGFSGGGPVQLVTTTVCAAGDPPPCVGAAGGAGQTVTAPTWTAADGVSVSGAGGFGSGICPAVTQGDCQFFGTSAAAPHAAGVAALVREALGGSPTIFEIHQRMAATATDRGVAGTDNVWGAGVLNARAATSEEADLRVTKECLPQVVDAGQQATCTILVDNLGPTLARTVQLTDKHLSAGAFSFGPIATSQGTCSPPAAGVVTCALGDLPAASPTVSGRATVTVKVSAVNATDIGDIASVVSSTPDPDMSNNEAQDSVAVRSLADMRITKTDAPDPVTAGTNLTYTLAVANDGPSSAANVVIRDVLSARAAFVSAAPSQGACQAGVVPGDPAKPLLCNLGSLASGAGATLTVVVKVDADVPAGTILVNNADVSSDEADSNTGNNVATASTTVQASADVSISKTSDAPAYKPSSTVTYRIDVVNNGPSNALNVVVTDNLPGAKQAIYQADTGGCVTSSPGTLTCNVGDLAVAQTKTFFVYVTVKGSAGAVSNTAAVSSPTSDPNSANNTSTRVVVVKGGS